MTEHWQVSHSIDKRPVQKTVVLVNDKALNLNDKVPEKQKTCEKHQLVTRVISDTSTFTVTKAEVLSGQSHSSASYGRHPGAWLTDILSRSHALHYTNYAQLLRGESHSCIQGDAI